MARQSKRQVEWLSRRRRIGRRRPVTHRTACPSGLSNYLIGGVLDTDRLHEASSARLYVTCSRAGAGSASGWLLCIRRKWIQARGNYLPIVLVHGVNVHKTTGSAMARKALERIGGLFDIDLIVGQNAERCRCVRQAQVREKPDRLA